jgi:hypothetical protein
MAIPAATPVWNLRRARAEIVVWLREGECLFLA